MCASDYVLPAVVLTVCLTGIAQFNYFSPSGEFIGVQISSDQSIEQILPYSKALVDANPEKQTYTITLKDPHDLEKLKKEDIFIFDPQGLPLCVQQLL
ncbi:MAG: hypothetical protein ACK4NR_08295 [Micavibrio sp.]